MPLQVLKFKAGIVKDITQYASGKNGPYFIDGNLVRFRNGYPTKIGGWEEDRYYFNADTENATTVTGVPKEIVSWRANSDSVDRIAIGTHNHLYVLKANIFYDISPVRKITSNLTNPVVVTNASTTVTITDADHGAFTGDFIVINSAATTGGVTAATLNRLEGYQITVVDDDDYTFTVPSAATSGVTGGGTTIDITYLIGIAEGVGFQNSDPALGFGVGTWGESTWGTARSATSSTVSLSGTQWSLALWGEDLIINNSNGQLYYWDTSDNGETTRAALVSSEVGASGVPISVKCITVSFPDRHLVAGGCTPLAGGAIDPMLVRWSNQEDFVYFTPTSTNTAGDQRLEIGTEIISMIPTKDETFIQTDEAAYGMSFVGPPFTFSFRLLAVNCGAVSLHGSINVDSDVYWMGRSNFFVYNGAVQELPCSVQDYVFDRIQLDYLDKIYGAHNKRYNEVTWFYVSTANPNGTQSPEPDSYVSFNYADGAWTIGSLDRNVWHDAVGFRKVPFAFDSDGKLYNHETGTSDNGSAMSAYIETSEVEIDASGNKLFMVDKIIPDATMTSNTNLYLQLKTRKYPNATETIKGAFTVTSSTDKISTRAKGRQMAVKFYSTGTTDDWSLGDFRVNTREDGLR